MSLLLCLNSVCLPLHERALSFSSSLFICLIKLFAFLILKVLLVPVVPVGSRPSTIDDSSKLLRLRFLRKLHFTFVYVYIYVVLLPMQAV